MKRFLDLEFLNRHVWSGVRKWVFWLVCLLMVLGLGIVRKETAAEFTFASLALFPVAAVAWAGGRGAGLVLAGIAATMWALADMYSQRPFSAAWIPVVNALVRALTYAAVVLLVAQVRRQLQRERLHATSDDLTGLYNRRYFLARGADEIARAKRYGSAVSVLFLDLDDFKTLNDTAGHLAGDRALQAVASALAQATRENDIVSRLGGDEFAVVLPEIDFVAAQQAARKIHQALQAALQPHPPVSVSVGLAWFAQPEASFERMLNKADDLMYQVKASGKGRLIARPYPAPPGEAPALT